MGSIWTSQVRLSAVQPEPLTPSFYVFPLVWKGPDDFVMHLPTLLGEMSDFF